MHREYNQGLRMPNCGQLTWKAKEQSGLNRTPDTSELWNFARTWINRFKHTHEGNFAEKFIYLWVTVNAWLSMSVPDASKNHEDAYLIHSMASDQTFKERFLMIVKDDENFRDKAKELISLAPVFQVLWMRNNHIGSWDMNETRKEYIENIKSKNPYHNTRDGQKYPAFAPACAFEHLDISEPIPLDWPHVLHMIYQIRCNLFHGGKSYDSMRDKLFIELAYTILWKIWKQEIPSHYYDITENIEWERAFIRSGFVFKKKCNTFDFSEETESNRQFLKSVLEKINLSSYLQGSLFSPLNTSIEEAGWLNAIEDSHGGAEGGTSEELRIMDTYVAGIIRWINKIGIETWNSCDGHERRNPTIQINDNNQKIILDSCLQLLSNGRWRYERNNIKRITSDQRNIQANQDRYELLNIAEKLYHNMEALGNYISAGSRIANERRRQRF